MKSERELAHLHVVDLLIIFICQNEKLHTILILLELKLLHFRLALFHFLI